MQVLTQQLNGYEYDPGLRDQNAVAYLLKRDWARQRGHVSLIQKQYCMNCYWRDLLDLGDLRSDESRVRALKCEVVSWSLAGHEDGEHGVSGRMKDAWGAHGWCASNFHSALSRSSAA